MLRYEPPFHRVVHRTLNGIEEPLLVRAMNVVDERRVEEAEGVLLGVPLGAVERRVGGVGEDGVDAVERRGGEGEDDRCELEGGKKGKRDEERNDEQGNA